MIGFVTVGLLPAVRTGCLRGYAMSFCYAQIIASSHHGELPERAQVLCDTKVELVGAVKANWSDDVFHWLQTYGMAKTIILGPKTCLSFAGNDLRLVNNLLEWVYGHEYVSVDELIDRAFDCHRSSADYNDIEFLIMAKSEDERLPKLTCIKEGTVQRDCRSAWIGSPMAFERLQELRGQQNWPEVVGIEMFWDAMMTCGDDSVGSFPLLASWSGSSGSFVFDQYLYTTVYRSQLVEGGSVIKMWDTRKNGGFAISARDAGGEPVLEFIQSGTSVLYTRRYRYIDKRLYNPMTSYLQLPIPFESGSGKVLAS